MGMQHGMPHGMKHTMWEKKYRLPKIGMRIIKSAVGVFLCTIADTLFRGGKGVVFYAQLSVLWCMQDYVSETKSKAFQRFIGTVIGCAYIMYPIRWTR